MVFVVKSLLLLVPLIFFFIILLTEFKGVINATSPKEKAPVFDNAYSDDDEPIPNLFGPSPSPSPSNSPVQSPHQSPQWVSSPSSSHHSWDKVGSSSHTSLNVVEGKRPSHLNVPRQRPMPFANYLENWEHTKSHISPGTYSPPYSISPPKKAEADYNFGSNKATEEEAEDWSKKSPFTDYESPKEAPVAAASSSSSSKVVPKHSASLFTEDSPTISPVESPMGSQRWEDKFKSPFEQYSRQQEMLRKQPSMDENPFAKYVEAERPTGSHISFGEVESPKPDDKFTNRFRNGQSNDGSKNMYPLSAQQQQRGLDQDMIAGRMQAQLDSELIVEEEHKDATKLELELILYKFRQHLPTLFAPADKDSHFAPLLHTTALLTNTLKNAAAKKYFLISNVDSTDMIEVLVTMSNKQRSRMQDLHGYKCEKITKINEVSKSSRYQTIMSSLCTMDRNQTFWHDEAAAMEIARQIDDYLVKYETKAGGGGKGASGESPLDKQTSSSLAGKPVYDDEHDSPRAFGRIDSPRASGRFDSPRASGKSPFGAGDSFARIMSQTTGWSPAATREEDKGKVEMEQMIAKVMAETNYSQLRLIFEQRPNGMTLGQRLGGLRKNSHFLQVLRAFATDVHQGRPHFFAMLLKQKLEKLIDFHSLNDDDAHRDICRILVTRANIDLPDIVDAFTDIVYSESLGSPKTSVTGLLRALDHVFAHNQNVADKARLKAYIQIVQLYQYAGEGNSISREQVTPYRPDMFIDVAKVPDIFLQEKFHPKLTNTPKPDGMQRDPLNNGAAYYPRPLVAPQNNVYPLSMEQLKDSIDQEIMEHRILSQLGERIEQKIDRTNEMRMELILYKYKQHLGDLFSKDADLDVDFLLPITSLLKKTVDIAIGKLDPDSTDLIEVLVTMTNKQRKHLQEKYNVEGTADFCKKICEIREVKSSKRYQKMMHNLCNGKRDESFVRSEEKAQEDAEKIYEHLSNIMKGKKSGNKNEDPYQLIAETMAEKNFSQLRMILEVKPGKDSGSKKLIREMVTEMLSKEPKSHFWQVLNAAMTDVKDGRTHFFAHLLAQKLAKLVVNSGGNDTHWDICRIFVGRAPIDLADILDLVEEMPVKYSKTESVTGLDQILNMAMKKAGAGNKPKVAAYKEIVQLVRHPDWREGMTRQFNQHLAVKRLALLDG